MRDILVTLIVIGLIPYILYRPHIGILAWYWIGIMNPHRLGWGFAYNMPFAAVFGLLTIISLIFSKEPKKIVWTGVTILMALFILWMNVTTLFALNPENVWPEWQKVMKIQLMIFVTLMLMYDRKRLDQLAWIIVISLGFYGVKGGIFTIVGGGQDMVLGPAGSFIEGNTEISLAIIMALPLMRYLQLHTSRKWIRHALTVVMLLSAVSIIGSFSRGALVAGVGMGFWLWVKSPKKLIVGLVMLISVPLMLSIMPSKWYEKMGTIQTYEQDRSAMGRINAWSFAFNLAKAHPITGGGFKTFDPLLFKIYAPDPDDFHDAHSIYFQILAEHGFVGLLLYLMLGIAAWRACNRTIRQTKKLPDWRWARDMASMLQVSLIGFATGGAFLGLGYFDLYYLLVAMVALLGIYVHKTLPVSTSEVAGANLATRPFAHKRVRT